MMEQLKKIWNKIMPYVVVVAIPVILGLFVLLLFIPSHHRQPSPAPNNVGNNNPEITSSFSVAPKTSPDDSDLVIEHHYKATIDGEVVTVPIHNVSNPNPVPVPVSNPDTVHSLGSSVSFGSTATYKQELDLTPLLSDYEHKKNWEVGAGVGCHDGDVYFPVSIQRNFSRGAVEGVVHLSDSGSVNGGEVLFKKRF